MMRTTTLATTFLLLAAALTAQEPMTLTLDEAVAMAMENNPDYQARLNDEAVADWQVRSAYADFLPTASIGGGVSYQSGGQARIGSFTSGDIGLGNPPSYLYSSYRASVSLNLSGSQFYQIGRQKASREAVLAGTDAAARTLQANVTRQYLAVLRSRDAVDLARTELERAEANLSLAEARRAVESATIIEVQQAEVERGRAQVSLLQARSGFDNQKTRLLQLIGGDLGQPIQLVSDVPIFEPAWELESLVETAMATQPQLEAARASRRSAEAGVGMARSQYWPTFSVSTGLSGYTRKVGSDQYLIDQAEASLQSNRDFCELLVQLSGSAVDCAAQYPTTLTEQQRSQILAQNDQFPFDFTTEPVTISFGVSLPIFQGLNRQTQLETAHAAARDAQLQLQAEELRIRADVQTAYRDLQSAYQSVQVSQRNADLASNQLRLAQERYRVGSASFLELRDAESVKARADRDYLLGVYTFQESFTALEAAVGQDLAIPEN